MPRRGSIAGQFGPVSGSARRLFNDATGGTITTDTNYNGTGEIWRIHTFTSGGDFTTTKVPQTFSAAYGGGGGGSGENSQGNPGGRGGHGVSGTWTGLLEVGTYVITVGGGGAGAGQDPWGWGNGGSGGASSAVKAPTTVFSGAGGGGGYGPGDQNHPVYPSIGSPDGPRNTYTVSGASVTYGGIGGNSPGSTGGGNPGSAGSVVIAYRIG